MAYHNTGRLFVSRIAGLTPILPILFRYLFYPRTACVVIILPDALVVNIFDLGLLVVAVKSERLSLSILYEIAVKIVNISLPGRKLIVCLVNRRKREVVYRL